MIVDSVEEETGLRRVARWRAHSLEPTRPHFRFAAELSLALAYLWVSATMVVLLRANILIAAIFVVVPTLGLIVSSVLSTIVSQASSDDAALLEDADSWLAQIWIVQNDVVTGVDRGVVWSESGTLGFVGHRTSFVVTAQDVDPSFSTQIRLHGSYDSVTDRHVLSLRPPDDPHWARRNVYLYFRLLMPPPGYEVAAPELFISRLAEFQHERSDLTPQFPPLDVGPGSERRWMLRLRVLAPSVAALSLIYAALTVFGTPSDNPTWVLLVAIGLVSLAISKLTSQYRCRRLEALNGILSDQYGDVDRFEGFIDFLDRTLDAIVRNIKCGLGFLARFAIGTSSICFSLFLFVASARYASIGWHVVLAAVAFLAGIYFLVAGSMLCLEACRSVAASRQPRPLSDRDLAHWDF